MPKTAIKPTRAENYPEWYQQVIRAADLAENSPVRGCMVIKPWGYTLWENIQKTLDRRFKETGHENAYFPLFIPKSFLEKEAKHVEGFAKECAVVTHHRLEQGPDGGLVPAAELEEPLIVRPTSETIIGAMFSKWVQSYRDLPLLINQWCNIVRWEMRTRMFLRTSEFLWQEGHTVHATPEEAQEETLQMLDIYAEFAENYMAMPVIKGEKTERERFPGAMHTYTIEAMMQDGKALQAGTSHNLGQNFSRASDIKFLDDNNTEQYAYTTSWGVSTRLIGGLIMTHADDDGLILPPRLAPSHIVLLPMLHKEESRAQVMEYTEKLAAELRAQQFNGAPIRVEVDTRDLRGGDKLWSWVKKGIPMYLEVGPRDIEKGAVFVGRRDLGHGKRSSQPRDEFVATAARQLQEMQDNLFQRALDFRKENTQSLDSKDEIYDFFKTDNEDAIGSGFALCHFGGDPAVEEQLQNDLKVTVRCIPLDGDAEAGTCPFTGQPSPRRVVLAKAY